ncbi:Copper transport outer membrane protein, MctB [Saccharopolyspora shandongensis]|uniref:Copper transport outer membrane protein, MctB n=1 Tax=Saccharopolyspora shandongensis TaxID=418495 RepID=A0A1H3SSD1_9PSEU|nr:copper transporter [Saccharopolyspora shandongensis]SDZ40607.1 Copper transport outer membrane protein, MctB [Saccharopolyspora shandongensis]
MISLRYHIVSIAAVFLALAVGVLVGSTSLSGRLLAGVGDEQRSMQEQVDDLNAERTTLKAQVAAADTFGSAVGPMAVQGQLAQRSVVLIASADADDQQRDAVGQLLRAAGADVTGEVRLGPSFADPGRADQLRRVVTELLPAGVQLPTAADPGTMAGGLIGPLALLNPQNGQPQTGDQERAAAFAGLADGGFAAASPGLRPAQLAVVLTGGRIESDRAGDKAAMLARFAAQLDRASQGAVLAGGVGSADGTGPVGVVRADPALTSSLSTVDNLYSASGRVAIVLALREQAERQAGHYGVASSAQGPVPETRG